jgi:hypothetical protein
MFYNPPTITTVLKLGKASWKTMETDATADIALGMSFAGAAREAFGKARLRYA